MHLLHIVVGALLVGLNRGACLVTQVVDVGEGQGAETSLNLIMRFLLIRCDHLLLLIDKIACDAAATQRVAYQLV